MNSAQFLNIIPLSVTFVSLGTESAILPVIAIVIFTSFRKYHYNQCSFECNLTIDVICSTCVIIYFIPICFSKFRWLIWSII